MKEYHVPWDQTDSIPSVLVDQLMMAESAEAAVLEDMRRKH